MNDKDLTVIVATCNRSQSLEHLLQGFFECEKPVDLDWELLFVDNNSTDNTSEILTLAAQRLSYVRSVFEGSQGVSHARNRGAIEARGRFIFFMDDDASPSLTFLAGIENALKKYPEIKCFGAKVISHFPDKPKWFAIKGPYALMGILGIYDLGDTDKILKVDDPIPIGSGILIERDYFIEKGKFNTILGVNATSKYPQRGEDTDFMEQLMISGVTICYLPGPLVNHYPDLNRYDLAHLKRMFIGSGIGMARKHKSTGKTIFGVPRYLYRKLLEYIFFICVHFLVKNDEACVYYKTRYWITLGMITTLLGLHPDSD